MATGVPPRMKGLSEKSFGGGECSEPGYLRAVRFVTLVVAGNLIGAGLQWTPGHAETKFTPSASLSERYDSNVWYGPKDSIPPGRQSWDLVTNLGAQAQVENKSRLGDTVINAGVNAGAFAYNTDLAFVSTNVFASSDLSDWTKELLPGLRFNVNDAFLYTPETPAFLAGSKSADSSDIFSRGIQAVRANTFSNVLRAHSDYSLSRSVDLRGDYSYSIFRVGQLLATGPADLSASFFDNTVHTAAAGPVYRLEGGDTLFFKYAYMTAESTPISDVGNAIKYSAHSIAPEYMTRAFRGWILTMGAGATMVEQAGNRTFFSGKLALATSLDKALRAQVSITRQVTPAFFGTGGALISNVAQLYVSQRFSKVLQLSVSANYAHNESAPVNSFKFESITGNVALEYKITRTYKVVLSQEYNRFSYTGTATFDRHATMFTLAAEWK